MRALVLTTNYGTEQDEILRPVAALRSSGADVVVAATDSGPVVTLISDRDPGDTLTPDTTIDAVSAEDFELLVIPGGTLNADALRLQEPAQRLAKDFAAAGKTIASICHGPWLLVETGLVDQKSLTSWASLATDVRNAGGSWVDQELVVCELQGWTLVTSRSPRDLDAFTAALVQVGG